MKTEQGQQRLFPLRRLWVLPVALASAACSNSEAPSVQPAAGSGEGMLLVENSQTPVAGLPFAQGRAFATLDDYLQFRKSRGAHDIPWYREVRPGEYELVSRRAPGAQPQLYTRDELARKFGFAR